MNVCMYVCMYYKSMYVNMNGKRNVYKLLNIRKLCEKDRDYMYIYVCMYIYGYRDCIYIFMYVCMFVCMYISVRVQNLNALIDVDADFCLTVYVCMYEYRFLSDCVCMNVCTVFTVWQVAGS